MTIDSQIDKMNYFHDSEVIQVSYLEHILKLEMGYTSYQIEKYTIDSIAAIAEKELKFSKSTN
ncbi:hypothetical protein HCJ75_10350 [Listeria welshimeri]|nr:hypothetical protein [Listeria welshimeri]MBC1992434.1 hypothetical protein [Listeria welshimeri]MBC2027815.1 hypothetical protein [Listeria welshimeri]